jgi:hypothetical protein
MGEGAKPIPREPQRTSFDRFAEVASAFVSLQNSERRYDEALHRKIDALAIGGAHLLESERADDGDRAGAERPRRDLDGLRAAVGLEDRI